MWPRTDLLDLLGTDHPIIQAPMGGESTPEMAVAVSNAGGLGGVGCSFMSLEEIEAVGDKLKSGTNRPFNLNFFAHPEPVEDDAVNASARDRVAPFYGELGLDSVPNTMVAPCESFTHEKLEAVLKIRPKVVSFHFGLPPLSMVRELQDHGVAILCSATTVAEARSLQKAGVDAVIAQGWEAGGHRGTFHTSFEDFGVGSMALVPQIVDAIDLPVIAAGGIADGRGIAAAFSLGASGVQIGSAFLSCPEANVDDAYREEMRAARDDDTRLTSAFSGRPARAKNNRYIEEMAKTRQRLPDFPTMYTLSGPLQTEGQNAGTSDFSFTLYGQAAALNREMGAADLVDLLVKETQGVFANLNKR